MERVYCSFCEQTYVTSNLEKCSLCGKVGGLRQESIPDRPIVSDRPIVMGELLRSIDNALPAPREWRRLGSRGIELRRDVAGSGDLPRVCMRCGAPADELVSKNFSWHPGWVFVLLLFGVLPFIIVALMTMERTQVLAPMCARHKRHWSGRALLLFLTLLIPVTVFVIAIVAENQVRPGQQSALSGGLCIGSVLVLAAWAIAAIVVQMTAIRCIDITPDVIRLTNLSPGFVDAVMAHRFGETRDAHEPGADFAERPPTLSPPAPPDAFEERK